jgi:hypothetical protein
MGTPVLAGDLPLSAMLAIDDQTSIIVFFGGCGGVPTKLLLRKDDFAVWRPEFVHGGAPNIEPAKTNFRVHTFIDSPAVAREKGAEPDRCDRVADGALKRVAGESWQVLRTLNIWCDECDLHQARVAGTPDAATRHGATRGRRVGTQGTASAAREGKR